MMVREPQQYTGAWFRAMTDEQLQAHFDANPPGQKAYIGAAAEIARRQADRSERRQVRWIKATFWLGVVALMATILGATIG